jgi:MFS family permease
MPTLATATEEAPARPATWLSRVRAGFTPPPLPSTSRRAFRFHMAFILLDAVFAGIMGNAPLMAVKSMGATDVQLQVPLAMASIGLFGAVFSGAAMATRRKKPFVLVPGFAGAISAMLMAWMTSAGWFLAIAGVISICDFGMRPAVPSILRIVYPDHCRSHIAGTLRQYASIVFLGATLGSASLLAAGAGQIRHVIQFELMFAGFASVASYFCFQQLPDHGDGSEEEAAPVKVPVDGPRWPLLTPLLDRPFRRYLTIFFIFGFSNLFHSGILPAFFARDMGLGYVQATLLLHIIPNLTAFLFGGQLSSWFDRTSIWRSYAFVTLMWGLDPVILAVAPHVWPAVIAARILRGPATVGSMVICFFTGVHSFARPGGDTSRYMAALFLVNGFARLLAPLAAAFLLAYLSRRQILFYGGMGCLLGSALFQWTDLHPPAVALPRKSNA